MARVIEVPNNQQASRRIPQGEIWPICWVQLRGVPEWRNVSYLSIGFLIIIFISDRFFIYRLIALYG